LKNLLSHTEIAPAHTEEQLKQRFIFARPKKKENTGQPALRG
jgi:hypothetical protein